MNEPHLEEDCVGIADQNRVLDGIMAGLSVGYGNYPKEALLQARKHRDAITPRLIESLHVAAEEIRAGRSVPKNAHFCALFLLWEFQAKQALDAVIEVLSLPGDGPFDLFSDVVTECGSRILAVLTDDRWEVLDEVIRNEVLDQFVRWQAVDAFAHLARDGKISRDEAVARLRRHLREAIDRSDQQIAGALVSALTDFGAAEAVDEIREAFEKNLVDELMIRLSTALEEIASGRSSIADKEPAAIDDAIEELRGWLQPLDRESPSALDLDDDDDEPTQDSNVTFRYDDAHVGRNDPCPCGSGRKFKKCCGSRARTQIDL